MAFNDDSFIREVNEELRSDQMKGVWRRFGRYIIVVAILIVAGTAGKVLYDYWDDNRSSGTGDQFPGGDEACRREQERRGAGRARQAREGRPWRLSGAGTHAGRDGPVQKGDTAAAIAAFNEIGKDNGVPAAVRDAAKMRAGWLLIENGAYEQVSAAIEEMAVPGNAFRHSAREALGLAAYKAGNMAQARQWFQSIVDDTDSPRNVANRAHMMLDLITASGKAPAAQG
ncbi:tetratricopeptide repeat protein [Rhizobium leguminosarum bv. viciae]|nr:tetratricopeptide repeat protein [Rhizobium leguminosarum bv. viciae]